uniref:Chemokine interleukin-8-like domain-containing protein n=1 Tax=Sinocyclocheilus anshuiensis TaxID=1608454 RepID=A0A671QGR8_9TELE
MKISFVAFAQVWLMLVLYPFSPKTIFLISPTAAHAAPVWCCFDFIDFQIPSKRIVSAVETDSRCIFFIYTFLHSAVFYLCFSTMGA